jgi:hypothetical protein
VEHAHSVTIPASPVDTEFMDADGAKAQKSVQGVSSCEMKQYKSGSFNRLENSTTGGGGKPVKHKKVSLISVSNLRSKHCSLH